jgi:hypothetical protein
MILVEKASSLEEAKVRTNFAPLNTLASGDLICMAIF